MPTTTNLLLPYPAASDNPQAPVLAALAKAADAYAGEWTTYASSLTENGVAVAYTALYSKYKVVNKTCYFKQKLDITGSGTAGLVVVGLPPPSVKYTTQNMIVGELFTINPSGSTPVRDVIQSVSGTPTTATTTVSIGFNLTNTCFIWTWGQYEVA